MENQWRPYQKEIEKLAKSQAGAPGATKKRKTTAKKARSYPERDELQIPLVVWFKKTYPQYKKRIFHFAGERKCSFAYGSMLKRMGSVAGTFDIFIMVKTKRYTSLWLELKWPPNKLRENQKEFMAEAIEAGCAADWADDLEKAKAIIIDYLS